MLGIFDPEENNFNLNMWSKIPMEMKSKKF